MDNTNAKITKRLTKNFTVTDNRVAQSGLSLRAKGLYWYIASLPDDWSFSMERIAQVSNEPVARIKAAFNELQAAGLIIREYIYGAGIYGRRANYIILDFDTMVQVAQEKAQGQKPAVEKPTVEKPPVEKPPVEKPPVGFWGDYKRNNNNKELNQYKELTETNTAPAQAPDANTSATKINRHKYGEYQNVLLSDDELEKIKNEFPADWTKRIEDLSAYIASTGKAYKSHLATIRNWARMERQKQGQNFQMPAEDNDPGFMACFR